jgi:endo-1,4-beta-xylanase
LHQVREFLYEIISFGCVDLDARGSTKSPLYPNFGCCGAALAIVLPYMRGMRFPEQISREVTMDISRRDLLKAGLALPVAARFTLANASEPSLRAVANDSGLIYGAAVNEYALGKDQSYTALMAGEAGMLVPEGAAKRRTLEQKQGKYNFALVEKLWRFAQENNQRMRGHTFVWHGSVPDWLEAALAEKADDKLLTTYIEKVATHFRGRFHSWDVVNEAVEPDDDGPDGLRVNSPWYKAFGPNYIEEAFTVARGADPDTLLFYNELNLEGDIWWAEKRRVATLKLLERLRKKNVPIDGLGIQSHLKAYRVEYTDEVFSKFLDEVRGLGLKVLLTEFDIADIDGPADPKQRDADIASLTKRYLDVAFSKPHVLGCLTWGITDRYSWLSQWDQYKWPDGSLSRGLPFDANLAPKPMETAMLAAYQRRARG